MSIKDLIYGMVKNQTKGNSFFENLFVLAEQGNGTEIENIARNVMKEKGLDFDKEFNSFKRAMKL